MIVLFSKQHGKCSNYLLLVVSFGWAQDDSTPVLLTLTDLRDNPPDVRAELNLKASSETHLDNRPDTQPDGQSDVGIDWGVGTEDADAGMPADIDWDVGMLDEIDVQDNSQSEVVLESNGQPHSEHVAKDNERSESVAVPEGGGSGEEEVQLSSEISWDVDAPAEIDWDIDVEEAGVLSAAPEWPPHGGDQQSSNEEGIQAMAKDGQGAPPASWFAKTENRNSLLDDLFEVCISIC